MGKPPLLERRDEFLKRLDGRAPALFLDYDGTLTPIVDRPENTSMDDAMRAVVRRLAEICTVAIVSGRDRKDVEKLVAVENIVYAGSHGFDISGPGAPGNPGNLGRQHEEGARAMPALDEVERELGEALQGIEGAQIERKKYSIAVHYRNVAESEAARVEDVVDESIGRHRELRKGGGKKVHEIQPDVEWDKGRAVLWLIEALELVEESSEPVYIGDDLTDEDAFRALRDSGRGMGVVVDPGERESAAEYALGSVDEVRRFLEWLADRLERERT